MKTILSLLLIASLSVHAQDSSRIAKTFGITAGHWGYLHHKLTGPQHDRLLDSLNVRMKPAQTLNTVVTIDSVEMGAIVDLYTQLKYDIIAQTTGITTAFGTAARALNQPYITSRLDQLDEKLNQAFINTRIIGIKRFRRQRD